MNNESIEIKYHNVIYLDLNFTINMSENMSENVNKTKI